MVKLTVTIVDDDAGRSIILQRALEDAGYEVVAILSSHDNLLMHIEKVQPDVIIVDLESPNRDSLESMRIVTQHNPRPIVMFTNDADDSMIGEAINAGVSAYVVDGFNESRIKPIMDVAIARFREFQALRNELQKTRDTLEERKIMEKAKGIVMTQRQCNENEAYKTIRTLAMENNKRIVEVAEQIISITGALKN
ncbi:MAG: ANTAR domain-containing protein [Gammaproteobacteria bacterium]|nr:ANTAR domain-containing protein [Gammaproteobacteria bacterium]